ncbi:MAG: MOSC domain-containing protein, partial [Pseudomonadota bacterium]
VAATSEGSALTLDVSPAQQGGRTAQVELVLSGDREGYLLQGALDVTLPPADAEAMPVVVWRDEMTARRVSDAADRWFSDYLGTPCHLVYQHEADLRAVAPAHGTRPGDEVSFADGYPVLLIGSASLDDLNGRLASPVPMSRFRTNIVADTDAPFVEDSWARIAIGEVTFDVVKRCARCVFTTVDPMSGQKDPAGEPLATLRGYRLDKSERGVMFGVNLVPRGTGALAAGQPIKVLETR